MFGWRKRPKPSESSKSVTRPTDSAGTSRLDEEDVWAQQAGEVRDNWEIQEEAVRREHRAEMQPMHDKRARALLLVRESGVGEAACDVLKVLWHWPSWSKLAHWNAPLDIDGLAERELTDEDETSGRGKHLEWIWSDVAFRLELTPHENRFDSDTLFGDLRLWVNDEQVLHLDVSQRFDDEYYDWRYFGVSGLRPGRWMAQLNDIAGQLRIAHQKSQRDFERKLYSQKVENIDLDGALGKAKQK